MKKIISMLLVLLNISCQSQQKNNMSSEKIKFNAQYLVFINNIPQHDDILSIELKKDDVSSNLELNASLFKMMLNHENTRILNPKNESDNKLLINYNYSPWYNIDFTTVEGNYTITLYLGGLGFITLPNGDRGVILIDLSALKNEIIKDEKLLSYYYKIKRKSFRIHTEDFDSREIFIVIDGKDFRISSMLTQNFGKIIVYSIDEDIITTYNRYPNPSKKFNDNLYIHEYVVKPGNSKVSFWSENRQVLATDKAYPKILADFAATAETLLEKRGVYGATNKILEGDALVLPDGLKIDLAFFSHKRVYADEMSPAIAHLEISDNFREGKTTIRRSENKDDQGKFITSYESIKWENYNIELTGLSYDEYIEIIVTKLKKDNK